ncbi:MAG: SMC-Scp complex subunit ScpB [Planctomycetes bacterium]|nr:SMC-Scp complex subunit ScpB [Planctomycetota bacterium]MCC7172093.1 SMC-Scp complex subunit ScpB [Planctomycetota bacterium]
MARKKRESKTEETALADGGDVTAEASSSAAAQSAVPESEAQAADGDEPAPSDETILDPSADVSAEAAVQVDASTEGAESPPAEVVAELEDEQLDRVVEALLFAVAEPLTALRIGEAAGASPRRVKSSVDRLRRDYAVTNRAFGILEIAGGFRLYSKPEFADYVARLDKVRAPERLSAAALETLAIVAYRQPIVRADIDAIRGVNSSALLKTLMERKLIRAVGRSERPGRPLEYGTTKRFLDHFGLGSVKDLPRVEDLKTP